MIKGDNYIDVVTTYFGFLITEYSFRLLEKEVRSNVFYDIQYSDETKIISISYENIEDYFLVVIFLLQDGKLPNYDDKTKTLHLNQLNSIVLSKINKTEIILNNDFFCKFNTTTEIERRILKSAKELRLCLKHFDELRRDDSK